MHDRNARGLSCPKGRRSENSLIKAVFATAVLVGLMLVMANEVEAQPVDASPTPGASPTAGSDTIEEIVVTARKREESAQKTPVSISVFSGTDLKNQKVEGIADIQRQTPSLTVMVGQADPFVTQIGLRGQLQNDTILSLDASVGIYVDGVVLPATQGSGIDHLVDVQRVEVLKGPQGTLYGRNTTGGAVNIYNNLPTDEFGGGVTLGYGNYGKTEINGFVNIPIVEDKAALRVVGEWSRHGGYARDIQNNAPLDDENDRMVRAALKLDPRGDLDIVLRADYQKGTSSGTFFRPAYLAPNSAAEVEIALESGVPLVDALDFVQLGLGNVVPTPLASSTAQQAWANLTSLPYWQAKYNFANHAEFEAAGTSATISYDLGSATLKSITSYKYLESIRHQTLDGSPFTIVSTFEPLHLHQLTQELQLTGTAFDEQLHYAFGGFYYEMLGEDDQISPLFNTLDIDLGNAGGIVQAQLATLRTHSPALYGQATYAVTPTVNITGGLRWTVESKDLTVRNQHPGLLVPDNSAGCDIPPAYLMPGGPCEATFKHSEHNISYTAGVDWTVMPDVMLYAKTSKGYKSGGINQRVSNNPTSVLPYSPETVTDYETGIKSDWLDHRLRVNLDYYHSDYSNIQRSVVAKLGNQIGTVIQNAASAKIDGVEADMEVVPFENALIHGTAAYTDARYVTFLSPGNSANYSAENFDNQPKWTYSISSAYTDPLEIGFLRFELDWSWRGWADLYPSELPGVEGPGTPDFARAQPAYGLLDGQIALHLDAQALDVRLWMKNIADERYSVSAQSFVNPGIGTAILIPGPPRTFGVEVSKNF